MIGTYKIKELAYSFSSLTGFPFREVFIPVLSQWTSRIRDGIMTFLGKPLSEGSQVIE